MQVCLVGMSRSYTLPDEAEAERRRAEYIQSRRVLPGVTGQRSDVGSDSGGCHGSAWGSGFQPRERVEAVRNCAALPRDLVDGVVLLVARAVLGMSEGGGQGAAGDWNRGGKPPTRLTADTSRLFLFTFMSECGLLFSLFLTNIC